MKVPYTWLKKLVPFRLSPESLAQKLTMAGLEVEAVEKDASGDAVLDIAVTSNRPDCLGMIGIAREVNTILSSGQSRAKGIKLPHIRFKESGERAADCVNVLIQDRTHCHRYIARIIKNVKVKESPPWLQNRLKAVGMRPVNNIVDVTNYVLMEYGQPLHAFDFKKIKGQKIVVRRAKEGEEITTLDGVKRELDRSMLVIADRDMPQALAGIIGGRDSGVTETSTEILLESAYFERSSIRRTSKKLGLSTDSSYRFERGADKEAVKAASRRASALIQELAGGEVLKGAVDVYPAPFKPVKIYLRLRRIKDIIGIEIEKPRIKSILKALGLKVEKSGGELWRVYIPSFRRDISLEIDLMEEIARHFGYNRIPATLPDITIRPVQKETGYQIYETLRDIMGSAGFYEVVNFSFLGSKEMEIIRPGPAREPGIPITIKNPLSDEQGVMRLSLAHGLLKATNFNLNKGEKGIRIFELGKVYFETETPQEEYCLGALCLESASFRNWRGGERNIDFYDMKGVVELILDRLGIGDYAFQKGNVLYLRDGSSALIYIGTRCIGWIGEVDEKILAAYDINEKAFLFELYLNDIIPSVRKIVHFKELQRFPASFRDISVVVAEDIASSEITKCIRENGETYLEKIELIDLYQGEQIPPAHRSLTYRLSFRSSQRTLREDEVNDLLSRIISGLKSTFSIELRK